MCKTFMFFCSVFSFFLFSFSFFFPPIWWARGNCIGGGGGYLAIYTHGVLRVSNILQANRRSSATGWSRGRASSSYSLYREWRREEDGWCRREIPSVFGYLLNSKGCTALIWILCSF